MARARWRLQVACALALLLALFVSPAARAQAGATESAVKAAFLFKFASFVEWPPAVLARNDPGLVIGVAGNEAVSRDLEQLLAGRSYDGRAVTVRRVRDAEDAAGTHILLVGATRESRARELIASIPGPVLVVTEQENGLRMGGVINFLADGSRVRFAASVPAAEARGLHLSARLLAVATAVEGRSR